MQKPIITKQEEDKNLPIVNRKLKELGILFQAGTPEIRQANKERLLSLSAWTEEELKEIEEARKALNTKKAPEW